jgi:hypothetical protein
MFLCVEFIVSVFRILEVLRMFEIACTDPTVRVGPQRGAAIMVCTVRRGKAFFRNRYCLVWLYSSTRPP